MKSVLFGVGLLAALYCALKVFVLALAVVEAGGIPDFESRAAGAYFFHIVVSAAIAFACFQSRFKRRPAKA